MNIHWSSLRVIGNSPIAKSALFVPVLGYFLLFNDAIAKWLRLNTQLCGENGCAGIWKLQCLYYGGCMFAVGAVLYAIRCPGAVKKYGDSTDYTAGEANAQYAHKHTHYRDIVKIMGEIPADHPGKQAGDIYAVYDYLDEIRPFSRRLITLMYLIGTGFIVAPTLATFCDLTFRVVYRLIAA